MSWESEDNKRWSMKPLWQRVSLGLGYAALGILLIPLVVVIGISKRLVSNE